ncbi:Polyadenylate-binding protein RBP47 [Platanthera zijinensis]|uniref:Polyadenylate-binding protein RBP47 n=1 Tax=Platanthera zijinensis TaxID=2320716 RepID=A0AAP0FW07_9ASPA
MQQALIQQQLYHSGILAAISQMEPVPSGNLPPGFDSSTCRSVYVGNIHPQVTEALLAEVFQNMGPLEGCKLIRKDKSSYGFVDYHDRRSASLAIMNLNGRHLYGQPIKVNWAYASGQREDTTGHFHIFVGDLSSEVTDSMLFNHFQVYPSCSDARVMWDNKSGRSRGYGFVSFRSKQDAENAINEMTGKWLVSRQIRCNWATKNFMEEKPSGSNQNAVILTNGNPNNEGTTENLNDDSPENNPAYTTVYIGNLAHEVTQAELHRQFHNLGVGVIEEVRIQRDKGFGFVRYQTHKEAAAAIMMANGKIFYGKSIKCCWGNKPTPPGTSSNPLPPPGPSFQVLGAAGLQQGYSAADLLTYQRQLALSQVASAPLAAQQGLAGVTEASVGLIPGGSQAIYDGGYPSHTSAQQLMYYS